VVGEGWAESLGVLIFGTVINLDPSLLVYFAVFLEVGERGGMVDAGGGLRLPFIFVRGLRGVDCGRGHESRWWEIAAAPGALRGLDDSKVSRVPRGCEAMSSVSTREMRGRGQRVDQGGRAEAAKTG
jgi:hypothetical protein